jgi:hypothetical protein
LALLGSIVGPACKLTPTNGVHDDQLAQSAVGDSHAQHIDRHLRLKAITHAYPTTRRVQRSSTPPRSANPARPGRIKVASVPHT